MPTDKLTSKGLLPTLLTLGCLTTSLALLPIAPATAGPARGHKVQVRDAAAAAQVATQDGRLIADYDGFKLYEIGTVSSAVLSGPGFELRDDFNVIALNAGPLDTSTREAQALRRTLGEFPGKRLHLVQFAGPIQPGWHDALVAAGAQIVTYIPANAYLIYGDAKAIGQVQALAATAAHIQWDGAYADEYKIHPDARTVDANGNPRQVPAQEFAIQLVADAEANAATLALVDRLKLAPTRKKNTVLNYRNLIVRLAPENLGLIATHSDVVSIMPYYPREKFCERQAQIVAGSLSNNVPTGPGYLEWLQGKGFTLAQFTNSNFAADVTDSGIDNGTTTPNHFGLWRGGVVGSSSRVIYNRLEGTPNDPGSTLKGCDGHGTLNTHIIAGYDDRTGFPHTDAAGYHYGLGICPWLKVGSSVIFDPDYFTFPDYANLQSEAYHDNARVSNNSWGANTAGAYDIDAQEYDALVRDAQPSGSTYPTASNQEMVIVFAAGNAGPGARSIGAPGVAKNVFTIGAAENVQAIGGSDYCGVSDNSANNANDIVFFSSRGPCADGRRKPDLVAPGTHVSGGVLQTSNPAPNGTADPCFTANGICGGLGLNLFFPIGQQFFSASSGTSHSTPCVVGGCALVRQNFINHALTPPSPAMTKAYLMNSARYMTGSGANDTLWSNNQGMGEMNLGTAFDDAPRILRDELPGDMFTATGQSRTFRGVIPDSTKPFRVTLAWTDAPGSTTGNAYRNDLDLIVTAGGSAYKGNVFSNAFSVVGGTPDFRNNVESVFLPAGVSGEFSVTIAAVNINSDAVPGNGINLDQDFALIVYNAIITSPPTITDLQPTNLVVLDGGRATFTVTAAGTTPLSYQWRFNGTSIASGTNSVFSIAAAQVADSGSYSAVVTNPFGTAISGEARLTVLPTVPLPYALNNSNFTWTTDANLPWYGQTNISHDGVAAAQTFPLADAQQASLRSSVAGPGTLGFWWKVSSQAGADLLSFSYNGATQAVISGEVDWEQRTIYLPVGVVNLQWTYSKDTNNSAGQDRAWVDQVDYVPGGTAPFISTQPASQSSIGGAPVTFSVAAAGTPQLTYQWRFNGTDIPGATASSYTVASPQSTNNGAYSVFLTNAYGNILSSNAFLGVVPMAVAGDNSFGQLNALASASNAIAIAAGAWHSLALCADGKVVAWGNNSSHQCDPPPNLAEVVALAAGGYHNLALKADGSVASWGGNTEGQANVPTGLADVVGIAAGTWHSAAVRSNGTVVAWGDNSWGQTNVPPDLHNAIAVAAGGNHTLALRADGTVVAWGQNTDAEGNTVGQSVVPWDLTNVVAIAAGDYHSLAVKADGTVVAWGADSDGQIQVPPGLPAVATVAGGGAHTLALKTDGSVAAWGANWNGQCDLSASISNVLAVAAGNAHSLLLLGTRPGPPRLLYPAWQTNRFSVAVQTVVGQNYTLEYKASLTEPSWTALATVRGNGAMQYLADPNATSPHRFYRVRQW